MIELEGKFNFEEARRVAAVLLLDNEDAIVEMIVAQYKCSFSDAKEIIRTCRQDALDLAEQRIDKMIERALKQDE